MNSFLAIATVNRSSNTSQLREFYEKIRFLSNCLDSLGIQASECVDIFQRFLMRSLPEDVAVLH